MRCGSFGRFPIVSVSVVILGLLLSCGRDSVTRAVDESSPSAVTIDPGGAPDFFLASKTIDGRTDGHVDGWAENLRVVNGTSVQFDVVLVNESKTPIYPLLFLYVTETAPPTVHVANCDSRGFGNSYVFDFSGNVGNDGCLQPGGRSTPKALTFDVAEIAPFAIDFRIVAGEQPVGWSCPAGYPTVIFTLPPDRLQALRAEFAALNPNVCSDLNSYGFTEGFCSTHPRNLPDGVDVDSLIADAKTTLAENVKFTGVSDSSSLVVVSHVLFGGELQIYFAPQVYQGVPVVHTDIRVRMDAGGVRSIHGNHYSAICVPPRPILRAVQAQESIIGLGITWYDFGGHPRVHIVTEDDLSEKPTKVILPCEIRGSIQLRVAWRIPVGMDNRPSWYVYVGTMNREILWIDQLFLT